MAPDNELVRSNPAKRVLEAIEGTHKKKNARTKNQQDGFLLYLKQQDRDLYRKVLFLIETMCRISEFAGLLWEDVDMKNRIITIGHPLQYKSYGGKKAE